MSIDTSAIMSFVPLLGAVVSLIVFALLMYACIRSVDQGKMKAPEDDWWDDGVSAADCHIGEHSHEH